MESPSCTILALLITLPSSLKVIPKPLAITAKGESASSLPVATPNAASAYASNLS